MTPSCKYMGNISLVIVKVLVIISRSNLTSFLYTFTLFMLNIICYLHIISSICWWSYVIIWFAYIMSISATQSAKHHFPNFICFSYLSILPATFTFSDSGCSFFPFAINTSSSGEPVLMYSSFIEFIHFFASLHASVMSVLISFCAFVMESHIYTTQL